MKTVLLIMFCLVAYHGANAQKDSTAVDTTDHVVPPAQRKPLDPADTYRSTDPLIRIRIDAVPTGLRETLSEDQYRGWEQGFLHQNKKTFEYLLDIRQGDSLRTFRFDRFGNPVNPKNPPKDNN